MKMLPSGLLALIPLLSLQLDNAFALSDQEPPTAGIVAETFSPMRYTWQPVIGQWSVATGTYGNNSTSATNITTLTEYRGIDPAAPPSQDLGYDEFVVRARMRNSGTTNAELVGLIYGYQDAQNYYEVVVSAIGSVTMRTVMNGVAVDEMPSHLAIIFTNKWFEVEVRWANGVASVNVDGRPMFTGISQPEFTSGKVGLVTHGAVGRFDNVYVATPIGDQPFLERFENPAAVRFSPVSGQWGVVNNTYRNNAVQQTNVSLAPIHTGINVESGETPDYTFRARMLNPYGSTGNLIGIVFNYEGPNQYAEVVFSPTGVARVNHLDNGVLRTLATANYGGARNVAFEVTLENQPNLLSVLVNGVRLFANVADANRNIYPKGGVGLITHWAPGRFDNAQFDYGVFQPCALTFGGAPPDSSRVVSGTWNTNGGTLNSTAVGQSDVVNFSVPFECLGNSRGADGGTDFIYRARLLNEFGASGNLVGLVYNYHDPRQPAALYAGDYFEVTFSPTGVIQLNKFVQGVRYPERIVTRTIPRNTWFDVEVIRTGISTEVRFNGTSVVSQIQGDIRGGGIGVITHWTKGRFDNVSLRSRVARPQSEL